MPLAVSKEQGVILGHRVNFIGRPTGSNTVSWDYTNGETHVVKRPDDAQPATRWQVSCKECGTRLQFVVHSVQATRSRQTRWRAYAWAGLVVLIVSVVGCFTVGDGALAFLIPAAVLGAVVGYSVGQYAAEEMGITGHGAGKAYAAKHSVTLIESRPDDQPELICEKCGHREEYPWGSQYRKTWVDKQYQAAKERMDAHSCHTS